MMLLTRGGLSTIELEQLIAGTDSLLVVLALAVLLGLRHAADPDHLVAVSTLVATDGDRPLRRATVLGLGWGLGHATSLVALGLPVVLVGFRLPDLLQTGAEVFAGLLISVLALRLLLRWQRGRFHAHTHAHGSVVHRHLHDHGRGAAGHGHAHVLARTPVQAAAVGLVHGVGGSAAVGILLVASIADQTRAAVALALFAFSTAIAMTALSFCFGWVLGRTSTKRKLGLAVPTLGVVSLGFGILYAAGALGAAL